MLLISFAVYITAYFGFLTAAFFILTFFEHKDKLSDPSSKKTPFVSFIVPVFNEEKAIKDTIQSLLQIDYPKNKYEIIIIDDGSTDNTYKVAKKFESQQVRVFTKENGGCPSALNFGIKKAKGELIARFDADTTLAKDALKKIIGYFENPKVMSATSSLNVKNHKGFLQNIQWAEYLQGIFLRKIFDLNNAIHVIPGPLSLYRAEFFSKYGGFDEKNITEDTEMAMRIQSKGYEIRNSISANVYTIIPETFAFLLKQRTRWYTGFLKNAWAYRSLSKKKNNLSLFILPAAIISVFLAFLSFFIMAYFNFGAIKGQMIKLSVTGFSFSHFLSSITFSNITDFLYNYFSTPYFFFLILGLLLMLFFFIIAKYASGEKRNIFWACFLFFIFYIFFFILWWGIAIFYMISGKKQTWGKRVYIRGKRI
ncbi:hypothetical protein COS75_02910 [Candidatus Pacearchaeota archaeon CG06_land_8_20_14_3_00_35_12]|nr:MAG: hypothetical protein COS75_02910 [Candidatus Pacearchaeota archaeon CG06_land_8_20_14_3_00_35_12]